MTKPHPQSQAVDAVRRFCVGSLLMIVVAFVVYWPALTGTFQWDDDVLLTENALVKASDGLRGIWFSANQPDYFPLTSTAFWIQWRLWGMNPVGYHVVNVLLHALGVIVLWRVLVKLHVPGAWFASLIFLVHPVCVASVAWIAELKNTLSFVFVGLSFLFFLRGEEEPERRFSRESWFSLGCFVLALLSKTSVVMLPCVMLGVVAYRRRLGVADIKLVAPFFAAAFVMGLVTLWFQSLRVMSDQDFVDPLTLPLQVAAAGKAIWFYWAKALWPTQLSMIYPQWAFDSASLTSYIPALGVVALFAALWGFRRTWGGPAFYALAYGVVMLFPVLGFLKMSFLRYSRVADHWQYLSIIGVIAFVVGIVFQWCSARNKLRWVQGLTSFLAVVLGVISWQQSRIYRTPEALWRDTLAENPSAWAAHLNLGKTLAERGDVDAAIECYTNALRLKPDFAEAYYNLGNALSEKSELADAKQAYTKALEIRPRDPRAHYNFGLTLEKEASFDEALRHYTTALEIQPSHFNAHNNLGRIYAQQGDFEAAAQHFSRALEIFPGLPEAHNNLANILNMQGRLADAIQHYRQAIALKPGYAEAHNNLGDALQKSGSIEDALNEFREAVRLRPGYLEARLNVGMALMTAGRLDEAEQEFRELLRINPGHARTHYLLASILLNRPGDAGEGKSHWEEALRLDPSLAQAAEQKP